MKSHATQFHCSRAAIVFIYSIDSKMFKMQLTYRLLLWNRIWLQGISLMWTECKSFIWKVHKSFFCPCIHLLWFISPMTILSKSIVCGNWFVSFDVKNFCNRTVGRTFFNVIWEISAQYESNNFHTYPWCPLQLVSITSTVFVSRCMSECALNEKRVHSDATAAMCELVNIKFHSRFIGDMKAFASKENYRNGM